MHRELRETRLAIDLDDLQLVIAYAISAWAS
jgi:hypothetical protein